MAMVAILLNALLPTVSLAFEPAPKPISTASGEWLEICTTQGTSWVQLGPEGQILAQTTQQPGGTPTAAHNGHCPYCLTHAASFALPPAPAVLLPAGSAVTHLLPQAELQVHTCLIWLIPAARAPPCAAGVLFASTRYDSELSVCPRPISRRPSGERMSTGSGRPI